MEAIWRSYQTTRCHNRKHHNMELKSWSPCRLKGRAMKRSLASFKFRPSLPLEEMLPVQCPIDVVDVMTRRLPRIEPRMFCTRHETSMTDLPSFRAQHFHASFTITYSVPLNWSLLRCDAIQSGRWLPTFCRNTGLHLRGLPQCQAYIARLPIPVLHTWLCCIVSSVSCGGGFEYLHRSPASRRRRRKENSVSVGITGPPCSWEI
jgi:hypothetical protein